MNPRTATLYLLSGSAALAVVTTQHATFRGRWFIEASAYELAFTQCGAHDKWLVVLDSSLLADTAHQQVDTALVFIADSKDTTNLDSIRASLLPPPVYVVVQGDTSPRGSYGAKGAFSHRLLVHHVDSIPASQRATCS